MAPIPSTDLPTMPASFMPWIMWLVIIALSLSGLVAIFFVVRWAALKAQKAFKSYKERKETDKTMLPTHMRSFILRPVILPLPVAHLAREKMAYEEQCITHKTKDAQPVAYQSVKRVHISSSTRGTIVASTQRFISSCSLKLASISSSSRTTFKNAPPSWVSNLVNRLKVRTDMVPSETMDLPMQMPPSGWEDEIEPPREIPPNINNNDELYRKAMAKMEASIRRGPTAWPVPENDRVQTEHIFDDHLDDNTTTSCEGTPVLDSSSDASDHETLDDTPPTTPDLFSDVSPPTFAGLGHSIIEDAKDVHSDIIDKHIATVTGYTSPKRPFTLGSYDSHDEINKRIAITTGFSPQKLHMEVLLWGTSSSPAQDTVLDLIDLRIAVVTAQASPRSPPLSPSSVYSPSPRQASTPRRTRPHSPTTGTPQTPTRGSRHNKVTASPVVGTMLRARNSPRSSSPANTTSGSPIQHRLFSLSSIPFDTPVKANVTVALKKKELCKPLKSITRPLPRPTSFPSLPSRHRSDTRRVSIPTTPNQASYPSTTSPSTTKLKGTSSRPPFIASSSTRLRPVARPSAAPPSKAPLAPAPSVKMLVSFEPTATPSPRTRKMWRSLAPSDNGIMSTRTKPAAGVGTKSSNLRPTWR